MDILKAEIERKRKQKEALGVSSLKAGTLTYIRQQDVLEKQSKASQVENTVRNEEHQPEVPVIEEPVENKRQKLESPPKVAVKIEPVQIIESCKPDTTAENGFDQDDADSLWFLNKSVKYTSPSLNYSKEKAIYKFFKALLKRWEYELEGKEAAVKASAKGKLEIDAQKRCKEYLKVFFNMCKSRTVPEDILHNIYSMVKACEDENFVEAHDWYLKTAIGNSAWPIGLTMVGIHERSGREKISKVAHVMNNELQRKYLTSMKRLMSIAQQECSHLDPSLKVM